MTQRDTTPVTTSIRRVSAADAVAAVRANHRHVVTFLGFSGAGYEDPAAVARILERSLSTFDPSAVTICAGATAAGVGAVYAIARRRGFATIGIVSSRAQQESAQLATDVDTIYVITDATWGGRMEDRTLSPVSSAMVGAGDEFIAVGGGDVARDEAAAAQSVGKPVRYIAADMNHALAIAKARKANQTVPDDFAGTLRTLFPHGD